MGSVCNGRLYFKGHAWKQKTSTRISEWSSAYTVRVNYHDRFLSSNIFTITLIFFYPYSGGNLYKRDLRNRRRSSNSRRRSRNSENAYNSNTQRSFNDEEGISQGETTQDEYSSDKSSDDEGMSISLKEIPVPPVIRIPALLKKFLGYDEYLITNKKKVCIDFIEKIYFKFSFYFFQI